MQTALTVTQMLIRICGVLQLILGLLIRAENMYNLRDAHIGIGYILVLSVIVFAFAAWRLGAPIGMPIVLVVVGLAVAGLGFGQESLGLVWWAQLLHVLLGVAAIGLAEAIGGRLRRERLASGTSAARP
jgi:hypothetical protein